MLQPYTLTALDGTLLTALDSVTLLVTLQTTLVADSSPGFLFMDPAFGFVR